MVAALNAAVDAVERQLTADLVTGDDDLLEVAVRYGYGSTEAFGRAFRAVHGTEPPGLLAVSDDLDPDRAEGSELPYLYGVATPRRPEGLDTIEVSAGTWAVFRTEGPLPAALEQAWSATATEWLDEAMQNGSCACYGSGPSQLAPRRKPSGSR